MSAIKSRMIDFHHVSVSDAPPIMEARALTALAGGPTANDPTAAPSVGSFPYGAPTARIYQPARSVMQSGRLKARPWVLRFAPCTPSVPDPLMGWSSSADVFQQIELRFPTREAAVAYARRCGLDFVVDAPKPQLPRMADGMQQPAPSRETAMAPHALGKGIDLPSLEGGTALPPLWESAKQRWLAATAGMANVAA